MIYHLFILVLLTLFTSNIFALNIAQPQTLNLPLSPPTSSAVTPSILNVTAPTDPRLKCTKRPILGRENRPRFDNCRVAINSLPSVLGHGLFHTGHPYNEFRLPVRRSFKDCAVVVNLRDGVASLEGRWLEVRDAAMFMNEECRKSRKGVDFTGGKITAGVQAGLVIRLGSNGEPAGSGFDFGIGGEEDGTGNRTIV